MPFWIRKVSLYNNNYIDDYKNVRLQWFLMRKKMGFYLGNTKASRWLRGLDLNQRPSGYEHRQPRTLKRQNTSISTLIAFLSAKYKHIINTKRNHPTTTLGGGHAY